MWRVKRKQAAGHTGHYELDFEKDHADLVLCHLGSWADVEATVYGWKPPAWQAAHVPNAVKKWRLAIRAMVEGEARPLTVVIASLAWLGIGYSDLLVVYKTL